jgi:hypothetical protein
VNVDDRCDPGLFGGIETVVDQLFKGDLWPLVSWVANLSRKLALRGEVEKA